MDAKQVVMRYYDEVWKGGNVDAIDDLLAVDHVDETPPPGFDGTRESQKQIASAMSETSKDKTMEIVDLLVDGDRVAGVWKMTWTQVGDLWGMVPADGKRIELHGIDYFQLRDDRIVRTRHVEDWLGVVFRLGAFG